MTRAELKDLIKTEIGYNEFVNTIRKLVSESKNMSIRDAIKYVCENADDVTKARVTALVILLAGSIERYSSQKR